MKKTIKILGLAVLLITLIIGLTACGNKSKTTENRNEEITSKLSEQQKNAFNSQFDRYEGDDVSATSIRMLLTSITASNSSEKNAKIEVKGDIKDASQVNSRKSYKVSIEKDRNGVVSAVVIEEK